MAGNCLYFGDNLGILRDHIGSESVDLIYLDPPFNSNRSYNLLFKESSGDTADAQITAFDDTWHWGPSAEQALLEVETGPRQDVASVLRALVDALGRRNDMTAYLAMMTVRLLELHRVLKPTGSIYLHCDPTASHYLKVVMDAIFGPTSFRNEVVWKRTGAHSSAKRYGPVHDTVLFFSRSSTYTWNPLYSPHPSEYVESHYSQLDADGRRWMPDNLTAAGVRHGSSGSVWRGFDVTAKGNHWKFTVEHLEALDAADMIYWPERGGWPRYKRYLDSVKGIAQQDVWLDVPPINAQAAERLGYPTQKPLALLERIIGASSNPGDLVLDPFCGCGTAVCAAQHLGRRWIGIDVTHLAIALVRNRLKGMFGEALAYDVVGVPQDVASASALAQQDRSKFEAWALSVVEAFPIQGGKKGADSGLDGILTFRDAASGKPRKAVVQVKSGHVQVGYVRDLCHVVEREKAAMGFLITLEPPSRPMQTEALAFGHYHSDGWNRDYQRLQIRTVEELLSGKDFDMPPTNVTFEQATRVRQAAEQGRLL